MNEIKKSAFELNKAVQVVALILVVFVFLIMAGYVYYLNKIPAQISAKTEKVETEISNLNVGFIGDFTRKDVGPTKNYDEFSAIFRNIYGSLVSYTKDGKMTPNLATNWVNPDDTTWRFYLRKGVKFSNGKTLEAADVKYSFDTIKADQDSQFNEYFSEITAVNVISPDVVEVKTENPVPYLISKLSYLFIIPKDSKDVMITNVSGTGPFSYNKNETVEGEKLVLDRNEQYWDQKPKVKKIIIYNYTDEKTRIDAYKEGKIDIIEIDNPKNLSENIGLPQTQHISVGENGVQYIILNMNDKAKNYISTTPNPLNDKRVRQALWQALDTDQLIKTNLKDIAIPSYQVMAKQTFGYNPKIKRPEYNIETAKKLMKEAGQEKGFTVKLLLVDIRKDEGEFIQKSWKDIGVNVELELISIDAGPEHLERLMGHDFGMGLISWTEDTRDGQNTLLTLFGDSDQNMGSFKNEDLSKIMTDLSITINQKERQGLIQKGATIIKEEVPVIPLYIRNFNWLVRNNIKWEPYIASEYYFSDAVGLKENPVEERKTKFFDTLKFW